MHTLTSTYALASLTLSMFFILRSRDDTIHEVLGNTRNSTIKLGVKFDYARVIWAKNEQYYTQLKTSAQVGVWVNSVLTRNGFIKCYVSLFKKSFCSNVMHSKLKSKIPLRNHVHLKRLGVTPQKW